MRKHSPQPRDPALTEGIHGDILPLVRALARAQAAADHEAELAQQRKDTDHEQPSAAA